MDVIGKNWRNTLPNSEESGLPIVFGYDHASLDVDEIAWGLHRHFADLDGLGDNIDPIWGDTLPKWEELGFPNATLDSEDDFGNIDWGQHKHIDRQQKDDKCAVLHRRGSPSNYAEPSLDRVDFKLDSPLSSTHHLASDFKCPDPTKPGSSQCPKYVSHSPTSPSTPLDEVEPLLQKMLEDIKDCKLLCLAPKDFDNLPTLPYDVEQIMKTRLGYVDNWRRKQELGRFHKAKQKAEEAKRKRELHKNACELWRKHQRKKVPSNTSGTLSRKPSAFKDRRRKRRKEAEVKRKEEEAKRKEEEARKSSSTGRSYNRSGHRYSSEHRHRDSRRHKPY